MVEYRGEAIETLSMEERMTVRNMSIEGGANNTPITDISVDRVFIGSCTNSRVERKKLAGLAERENHLPNQLSGTRTVPTV